MGKSLHFVYEARDNRAIWEMRIGNCVRDERWIVQVFAGCHVQDIEPDMFVWHGAGNGRCHFDLHLGGKLRTPRNTVSYFNHPHLAKLSYHVVDFFDIAARPQKTIPACAP